MSLRDIAAADNKAILNDSVSGFGWPITVTDPSGFTNVDPLVGYSNDVSEVIDPDTGMAVSGRAASVAIHIADLIAAGFTSLPKNIPEEASKPWIVQFDDINGNAFTFKVEQSNPDRAIGQITCMLETYKATYSGWLPSDSPNTLHWWDPTYGTAFGVDVNGKVLSYADRVGNEILFQTLEPNRPSFGSIKGNRTLDICSGCYLTGAISAAALYNDDSSGYTQIIVWKSNTVAVRQAMVSIGDISNENVMDRHFNSGSQGNPEPYGFRRRDANFNVGSAPSGGVVSTDVHIGIVTYEDDLLNVMLDGSHIITDAAFRTPANINSFDSICIGGTYLGGELILGFNGHAMDYIICSPLDFVDDATEIERFNSYLTDKWK